MALAVTAGLVAAGCSDGDDDSNDVSGLSVTTTASTTTTTQARPSTTTTSTTTSTTEAPETTTTTAPPPTPTTVPFDGGTEPVSIPRPATTRDIVAHTDLALDASGGEERIVYRFDGGLPGVEVRYAERPIRAAGSGDVIDVAGDAVLSVRFEPASGARISGEDIERTYTGPQRVPGEGVVTELVRTGDFEALYEWAVGLGSRVPFRVETDDGAGTVTVVVPAG